MDETRFVIVKILSTVLALKGMAPLSARLFLEKISCCFREVCAPVCGSNVQFSKVTGFSQWFVNNYVVAYFIAYMRRSNVELNLYFCIRLTLGFPGAYLQLLINFGINFIFGFELYLVGAFTTLN